MFPRQGRLLLYLFEDYVLDAGRRELRRGGQHVSVEPQAFDLLHHLLRNRDRVVTKDDLLAAVWGGRIVSESALTSRINAARVAIGDSGAAQRLIRTLRGRGFRFIAEVREQQERQAESVTPEVAQPRLDAAATSALELPGEARDRIVPAASRRASIAVMPFADRSVAARVHGRRCRCSRP